MRAVKERFSLPDMQSYELRVAGYYTEIPADEIVSDNVKVLGTFPSEQMSELYSHTLARFAHQEASTGALARIIEKLIAGIPVTANGFASRSAERTPGI